MKWKHIIVTILIISGRSCYLLRRNTSSMISTPLPWTTRTLMQSISFHSWSSIVQCVTLSDISCLASKDCRSETHGNTQCWTPGQWWCWWGSTAQARPPSSGTFWNRWDLPIRLSLEILTLGLPWHQNRTRANHRQVNSKHHHCFGHSRPPIIP